MGLLDFLRRGGSAHNELSRPQPTGSAGTSLPPPPPLPPAPRAAARWVPAGQAVEVAGYRIDGGLIYFGTKLPAPNGSGPDPALIDPSLKVDWRRADPEGRGMGYWPTYSTITPQHRAGYLSWLASGRSSWNAPIGFVFLYFYGLERRVLVDLGQQPDAAELEIIAEEVRRLQERYFQNASFQGYSESFLDAIEALKVASGEPQLPDLLAVEQEGWELPVSVRLALGGFAAEKKPVPADWALALVRTHPEMHLRVPATRCAPEFNELFRARYQRVFGEGLKVRRSQAFTYEYRTASAGMGTASLTSPDVRDVGDASGLVEALRHVVEEATDALAGYSRFLGKNPDGRGTAQAVALLPEELLATHGGKAASSLSSWVNDRLASSANAVVPLDEVVAQWKPDHVGKLGKPDATALAGILGKLGFGIEPDVRFGASTPKPGSAAVLFRLPPGAPASPGTDYQAALTLVHLAAIVAAADGDVSAVERSHLARHLETSLQLDEADKARLEAHLTLLAENPPRPSAALKKRLAEVPHTHRARIGGFLVEVASTDGQVSPQEIAALAKLFDALGLAEADLYSAIHGIELGQTAPLQAHPSSDSGPVTVQLAQDASQDRPLPPESPGTPPALVLDHDKVQQRLADTAAVASLLSDIFTGEADSDAPPGPVVGTGAGQAEDASTVLGLDGPHSLLARRLAGERAWDRSDVEELAASLGLPLLEGALERINDAAFEICGEPLIEGDDPLEINEFAVGEVLA